MGGMTESNANCDHDPLDLLVITQSGVFVKADYPTMTHLMIRAKGGDAGTNSDGARAPGAQRATRLPASAVPDVTEVEIGKAGQGAPGQPDGEAGNVLIAVYACGCA